MLWGIFFFIEEVVKLWVWFFFMFVLILNIFVFLFVELILLSEFFFLFFILIFIMGGGLVRVIFGGVRLVIILCLCFLLGFVVLL